MSCLFEQSKISRLRKLTIEEQHRLIQVEKRMSEKPKSKTKYQRIQKRLELQKITRLLEEPTKSPLKAICPTIKERKNDNRTIPLV